MIESGSISGNPAHALGEGSGNYVVLRLSKSRFAFYEHLRTGSVAVRPGERVRVGQVIGALGSIGDTTGPHLHLHVADCASPLACEGMPFAISGMTELGRYNRLSDLGTSPSSPPARGKLAAEWPGYNVVVDFPG
jgi:murein DD-endopeptidase MepM/ murein hydrolase activator NlpD